MPVGVEDFLNNGADHDSDGSYGSASEIYNNAGPRIKGFSRGNFRQNGTNGHARREREHLERMRTENSFFGDDFKLMPIMNKLNDVLRDVIQEGFDGIHLPTLVAIGDQSHGKTSVLEAIVKCQFLPKGDQIQTRCPIEVRMIHIPKEIDSSGYAQILEEDNHTWTLLRDLEQVRKAIQDRTDKIKASSAAGVSEKRIVVSLYSPEVPNLTLVDLPGFLHVSTEGQTDEITAKIKEVVRKEISNPNCIILAVTAAGNNIGTSTALKEALRADPQRERTLGIVTKLDLMDKGTNCEDVLRGNQYKLQLGFIGVVCRNFEDNAKNKSIEEKIADERRFLEEYYPNLANRNGTIHLTRTISQLLLQRVYHTLPAIRSNIDKLIKKYQSRLEGFGTVVEPQDRRQMLVKYLMKFKESFSAQIDGTRRGIRTDKLAASANIQDIIKSLLNNKMLELMVGVNDEEIDRCIKNSHALHNMCSSSIDDAFQQYARNEVRKLREHVIDCAQQVNIEMINTIRESCDPEANKYPKLNNFITLVSSDVINECYQRCKDYLETFMDAEEALVYSSDPKFLERLRAKTSEQDSRKPEEIDPTNPFYDESIGKREQFRTMVKNYFNIVLESVRNHCPKAIAHLLVYAVERRIGEDLILRLDTSEQAEELMKESVIVQRDRATIQERLEKFVDAKGIINEVLKTAEP